MVVHSKDALIADFAVMGPWRFDLFAMLAVFVLVEIFDGHHHEWVENDRLWTHLNSCDRLSSLIETVFREVFFSVDFIPLIVN